MSQPVTAAARPARLWEASLVGVLLALAALAWVATGRLATPHMRLGVLTGAGSLSAGPGPPSVGALSLFLVTWTVMMTAMMLPAVAPVVATVDRWARRTRRSRAATALFVSGYLLVWGASGAIVYAAVVGLAPLVPSGDATVRAAAAALVVAGVYQLTPLKDVCLRQCRSPLGFVAAHATRLTRGGLAGARVGAVHGAYCLGCCWALMLVLVGLGMMSLAWMAVVAAVVAFEKLLPGGGAVSSAVGLVLVGAGVALLVSGQPLPALA